MGKENLKIELQITGMHCQACAKRVENALMSVQGVLSAHVNGATGAALVIVQAHLKQDLLYSAVQEAGYRAHPPGHASHAEAHDHAISGLTLIAVALLAFPFLLQMVSMVLGSPFEMPAWLQWSLATAVQLIGGWSFYQGAYRALRSGVADMDLLIAMGTTAAWAVSSASWLFEWHLPLYFESSVFIIVFVLLGRWIESHYRHKATEAIRQLLYLQPRMAHVEKGKTLLLVPVEQIVKGDVLRVLVGERIPVDAEVVSGEAEVDESLLTGESKPVVKHPGEKVYAGTLSVNGALRIKAVGVGADTFLAHIVQMVSQIQHTKAPAQRLADAISAKFVPAVIAIACATIALVWGWTGQLGQGVLNAISVLVIACPCALGLATPIVVVVAAGLGARKGILFKDAAIFEKVRDMQVLYVDKTGTLTTGSMKIAFLNPSQGHDPRELLTIAASLEKQLKHPLAQAIVDAAAEHNLTLKPVEGFKSFPGKGIEGKIGSVRYGVGSLMFARERAVLMEMKALERALEGGGTLLLVWKENVLLGYLILTDHVREGAREMVSSLQKMGMRVVMLTGDYQIPADRIARETGITEVHAQLLPQEKLAQIEGAKRQGRVVGMLGDGINDAPALMAADIGIALGASTDVALESASIALVRNDLNGVVEAIQLSRASYRKIAQNLFLAFIYNVIAIPLAVCGYLTPLIAAGAMTLSSLSVVFNALSLRWGKGR